MGQYYGLIFVIIFLLYIPIYSLKEIQHKEVFPRYSIQEFFRQIWNTLKTYAAAMLITYVVGMHSLGMLYSKAAFFMQVTL